jgi:ABC-type uncharacterized transport system auxiliary subunit
MNRRISFAFALAVLMILPSCFNITRPYKEVSFYQIEYDAPKIEGNPYKDVVVRLSELAVAPSYQSQKILFSTGSMKRKMYDYHMWVINPGDMLSDLLTRDMVAAGLYQAVVDNRSSLIPQYELEGIIEQIYEKDDGSSWSSVLTIRFIFFAYRGGKQILFQRVYSEDVKTGGKQPQDVVLAMSEASRRISAKVQADVNAAIGESEAQKKAEKAKTAP